MTARWYREYERRKVAEQDPELDLRIVVWECNKCGRRHKEYPGHNEGRPYCCPDCWKLGLRGEFQETGESYNPYLTGL